MEKLEFQKSNNVTLYYDEENAEDFEVSFSDLSTHSLLPKYDVNEEVRYYTYLLLEKLNLPISMDIAIFKTYSKVKKVLPKNRVSSIALLASLVIMHSKFYNYPTNINEVIKIIRDLNVKIKKRHILKCMYLTRSFNKIPYKPIRPDSFLDIIMSRLEDKGLIFVVPISEKVNYKKSLMTLSSVLLDRLKTKTISSNPRSIAACSFYASNALLKKYEVFKCKRLTQKHLAEASNLAEYTIRENYEKYFITFVQNPPKDLLLYLSLLRSPI